MLEPDTIVQLGYPPSRIGSLTNLSGVDFDECFQTRTIVDIDDIPINFIDLENLKKNKRASGRIQDLADLENLS